ncbi:MAG: protein kinase [Betaproteobacteria bacterium]|nr:protein kinase [Betaproteobacteria bacterium]
MPLNADDLRTLDRLLQEALDLPAAARAAWIDALPAPHQAYADILRAQLLVEDVATSDQFLEALPALPVAAAGDAAARAGERVGPYRLIRLLGEGGMGSVWLAERADGTLKREVALKLPHRHLLDRGLAARMARERDILAALNHDHIARLYEAGVDEQGVPYLAIEYVVGTPIGDYCRDQSLPLAPRLALMAQAARAVAHAHASLVVHRDLKPGNILVSTGDGVPKVKLLDFGIAKLLSHAPDAGGAEAAAGDLTQLLGRALTPDYASPEQLRDQPVTTASDIYSLGVVLYEVVTGEKPYRLKRQSAQALAEAVMNADVTRPSRRLAQSSGGAYPGRKPPRLDADIDAIIMKALKPEPAERYATASALADDLERHLAGQPVLARPDSWAYRTRRFVQRHALATSAGAAVLLALVAGAGVALWQAREARLETAKTKAVKEFLLGIITVGDMDQIDAQARRKQPIGDVLMDAAKTLPARFDDQPEIRAEIQGLLGTALANLSLFESAKALRETRLKELTARGAPLLERMLAQVELAILLMETPEADRGMRMLEEVIATLDRATDRQEQLVLSEALRTTAMYKTLRFDGKSDGMRDAERAHALVEVLEPGGRLHAQSFTILGYAYGHHRQAAKAEAAFERAIAIAKALPPTERAFESMVHLRYAEILIPQRYHQRALREFGAALSIIEQTGGRESFRWARTAVVMANLVSAHGESQRAFDLFDQVLKVYARMGAELDPRFMSTGEALYGAALVEHGRLADGLALTTRAYAPYRNEETRIIAGSAHWTAATRHAFALQAAGDYAQAGQVLEQALKLSRARGVSRAYSDMTHGERLLAINHLYSGEPAKAEALLKEIIEVDGAPRERFVSQRNFSRLWLGRVYLEQGQLDRAEAAIGDMGRILDQVAADEVAISRPAAAEHLRQRGLLALKRGDATAAEVHLRAAIALIAPRCDALAPQLAQARAELGLALLARGQRSEARKLADEAGRALASHARLAPQFKRAAQELERRLGG